MPSTVIRAFRYEVVDRRLVIDFQSGRRYAYFDVPPEVHDAMRRAHSRGSYFNRQIRDHYAYANLEQPGEVSQAQRTKVSRT